MTTTSNDDDRGGDRHGRPYVITVNSREEHVPDARVSFEQVVQLAFPGGLNEQNVKFSMTYRHVASKPHAGELSAGGSVEVKHHGSTFNVTRTVQS
jgi:hypothetical protein